MTAPEILRDAIVIDFETLPIQSRPAYPPAPTGVAIRSRGESRYYSWGHSGGGVEYGVAAQALRDAWGSGRPLLFHNARFDIDVAETFFDLPPTPWELVHDTVLMIFCDDPRADSLRLKDAAEHYLGEPPEEQDAVVNWLMANQDVTGSELSRSRGAQNRKYAGAFVGFAPISIVGPYAIGDVDRTQGLAAHLLPKIYDDDGLRAAYTRERKLLPILLQMERDGLRVDLAALQRDDQLYSDVLVQVDEWLREKLQAPEINLKAGAQVAKALIASGLAKEEDFGRTEKTWKMATNKEDLASAVRDPQLLAMLAYRSALEKALGTYVKPWRSTAETSGGYIYTTWHSTRVERGNSSVGTRTGRFSSTPNFQNMTNAPKIFFRDAEHPDLPEYPLMGTPSLPVIRKYVIAYAENDVLVDRDWSQQEIRMLAHYEEGALCQAFLRDPTIDVHSFTQKRTNSKLGTNFSRKVVKGVVFGLLYGLGAKKMAEMYNITLGGAREVRQAFLGAFPGVDEVNQNLRRRARSNQPFRTWGGRVYYCEAPKILATGKTQTFEYKMLNVLIQGGCSDIAKEAVVRLAPRLKSGWRIVLLVHDEIVLSVPRESLHDAMAILKDVMNNIEIDVPLLSDGDWSNKSFGDLVPYDTAME